jgi:hypothetical protein
VRRGAQWAFIVGLAVAGDATSSAHADVRTINLDPCSGTCTAPAPDDLAASDTGVAVEMTLSHGGTDGTNKARPALKLDGKVMPTVLLSGLPSPISAANKQAMEAHNVSPYEFFGEAIDIPISAGALTEISAASLVFFAPSLLGRLTLTDFLSNGAALFVHGPLHP